MVNRTVKMNLAADAEARPVAVLVQIASRFESKVYIISKNKKINAKSIMGMMSLGFSNGEELGICAEGVDEEEAVNEIAKYIEAAQ